MTVCSVLSTLPIDDNTAVVVEGERGLFRNGVGVLDENGKPFEVLSVGLDNEYDTNMVSQRVALLLAGKFSSQRIYI